MTHPRTFASSPPPPPWRSPRRASLADPFKLKYRLHRDVRLRLRHGRARQGIFAKHGLDADVTLIGINTNIPPAIVSNSIQIGGPTSTVFLQAVDGGLDLVAVAGASVMDPGSQRRSPPSPAPASRSRKPKDFVGKKVGAPGIGAFLHVLVPQMADREGRGPKERELRRGDFPDHERRVEVGLGRRRADRRAVHHADHQGGQRRGRRALRRRTRAHRSDHLLCRDAQASPRRIPRSSRRSAIRSRRRRRSSIPTAKGRQRSRSRNSPRCRSSSCA